MKYKFQTIPVLFVLFSLVSFSTSAQIPLKVCPNPAAPCKTKHREFYPYDLSFMLPAKIKPNHDYKSVPFFAVMLHDRIKLTENEECDQGEYSKKVEDERKRAQPLFPERKVFASHQCPDMAAIEYHINGKNYIENFVAVYAGETLEEANTVLAAAKAKYPKAMIKKMQAVYGNVQQ